MKKSLLTLALVAACGVANAASYTVFDIENAGEWTGDANGYTQTATVDGKSFTITTAKAASNTDLISPAANTYAWRVYKGSEFTIASADVDMTKLVITYDDYTTEGKGYAAELTLPEGWTGTLDGVTYTVSGPAAKSLTFKSEAQQVRIKKIVVNPEGGETPTPPTPPTPAEDGLVVFNIDNAGEWTGDANGFTQTKDVDGKSFTITTAKAASNTDLISPAANTYAWRVYKGSEFTIASADVDMTKLVITYDDYQVDGKGYASELTLPEGWTGTLDGVTYTVSGPAAKSLTFKSEAQQVRIKKIVVNPEGGETPTPPTPPTPSEDGSVVFDITAPGEWTGDANGWNNTVTAGGHIFTIATKKTEETASDLISPVANTFAWRVYKGTEFTITSADLDMKEIVITYDSYDNNKYVGELTLSEGWTGTLDGVTYKLASAGLKTLTAQSVDKQVRITKIVVKGETGVGVGELTVEDVPAVYYNLQGVRVANPDNGLYIEVRGDKARKVLIRK